MEFKTPFEFRDNPSHVNIPYEKWSWGDVDPEVMRYARNLIWHLRDHINDTVLLDFELVTLAMYDLIQIFEYLIPFTAKAAMEANGDYILQLAGVNNDGKEITDVSDLLRILAESHNA